MQLFLFLSYLLENIKACIDFWLPKCNQKAEPTPDLENKEVYAILCTENDRPFWNQWISYSE